MKIRYLLLLLPLMASLLMGCVGDGDIIGYVWEDRNNNGQKEFNEPFLEDIEVNLWECYRCLEGLEKKVATIKTGESGIYRFQNVSDEPNYTIEIILPDNYSFTKRIESPNSGKEVIDSDIVPRSPKIGISGTIDFETNGEEVWWVHAGLIYNEPPPVSAIEPTPVISSEMEVVPQLMWEFSDAPDDVIICGGSRDDDPEANIVKVNISRTEDVYTVLVSLAEALTNKYSFATILEVSIMSEDGEVVYTRTFIFELHNGIFKIGETEPGTGSLLSPQPEDVAIEHLGDKVQFIFEMSNPTDSVRAVFVITFHSFKAGESPHCDETETLELK